MSAQPPTKHPRGDTAVNRLAQAGHPSVLFNGKRYALSREHVYGTKYDRKTGERRIVILIQ